jgi:hypothetical protein
MPAKKASGSSSQAPRMVANTVDSVTKSQDFQARIFGAVSVQRPVVLSYLRSLRRDHPDATPQEILDKLDSRYIAAVTAASTGVGASAASPAVGIPIAIGLGVADLLFFYETSGLYVLAVAELHGVAVTDVERARPLVLGMLLGQKSQVQISSILLAAAGVGGAANAVGKALPSGWGEVLTEQLPDSALVPVATVIAREALKTGAKLGAGTAGKVIPFGIGAAVGGLSSFFFGREVTKATKNAFPASPSEFPDWLLDLSEPDQEPAEPSRATLALQAASERVQDLGETVRTKAGHATGSAAKAATATASGVAHALGDRANALFRKRRPDGDEDVDQG